MDVPILGTCQSMCPHEERILREREGLLHRFETQDGSKFKADPDRIIKCFSRSAAGQTAPAPNTLRPATVLLKTVRYIVRSIATNDSSIDVFEFVTDRLRAVRQDMTIQRLAADKCIPILEPMIRFHVFYGYKLSDNRFFDKNLNDTHLKECLHTLMACYKEQHNRSINRSEMEMVFTCVHINKPELVMSYLKFENVDLVNFELLLSWVVNNYARLLRLARKLPLSALLALSRHLPSIRMTALISLCHGFSSNNSSYPICELRRILNYDSEEAVERDCKIAGIQTLGEFVKFNKKDLKSVSESINLGAWDVIDDELSSRRLDDFLSDNTIS